MAEPITREEVFLQRILDSGGGGGEATGTIQITANGTYNVARYASANVNLPNGTEVKY